MFHPSKKSLAALLITLTASVAYASSTEPAYASLDGLRSGNGVFEIRETKPEKIMLYLNIIHGIHTDPDLTAAVGRPELAVVFSERAVTHLSASRQITPDTEQFYASLDRKITEMVADGITVEFCQGAARLLGLSPQSAVPAMTEIDNAWVSLIGYQQQGFAYIPGF